MTNPVKTAAVFHVPVQPDRHKRTHDLVFALPTVLLFQAILNLHICK